MHMISKKDLSNAEMDTLTKSCRPTIVIVANGEVQTHEEAIVYVTELDIFLTMKVLENTPAVQHGELRSARGSWFINEFFLKLAFFNIHDTFKAGNKLVYLTNHDIFNCVKRKCG